MSTWRPASPLPKWLRWLPGWMHGPLRLMFIGSIIGFVVLLAVCFYYFLKASKFNLDEVSAIPERPIILDHAGNELEAGWGDSGRLATRGDLPDFLVKSLLAREDANFFDHPGVDLKGLARATIRNIKDREFTQGASTLSMQLARNTYEIRAKSLNRKFLEIALTFRVENRYTKDEILTHYLNRIYFGSGCHGIEEAARTYLGKPVSELHQGECAMLVGIIRGPHIFSPLRNLPAARAQQREVLDRLIATGDITAAEKDRIAALPINLVADEQRGPERSYALHNIRDELDSILAAADIRIDGVVVRTALNTGWQLRLETEISKTLLAAESSAGWPHPTHATHTAGEIPEYLQCAAVTLDYRSGAIIALVGGRDFLDSRFDRSTGARRDLGAVFEPWIAAAAAERHKLVLPGKPLLTGRQIGPSEVARIAKRCGLGGPFLDTEDLFRGSAAATPMEVATALATLANRGRRPKPFLIHSVSDSSGKLLFERNANLFPAVSPNAADQGLGLLDRTAGTRCHTGATGSGRDAWLLRVGPTGATVIWLGFDQPRRITTNPHLDRVLADLVSRLGNQ